ncbi:hypothetical protein MIMGU_mgv1a020821mg [Erythranthe guttata]|uniref:KIB1-4 beta-propeller domain-containing protein n=1 Tax=Erythranthe guttata TaxID=4155 RepID=A0A022RFC9_ERYGU|nr:hypothetical protein MIMGU_mgv1a020821mg [Erythranthe guttata]
MSSDAQTLFLFDPFNNQTIELPPIPSHCTYNTICYFHPPTSPDCLIIGIILNYGEDRWKSKLYKAKIIILRYPFFCPPVLHDGRIYFLGVEGNVAWFDMSDGIWSFDTITRCFKNPWLRRNIKEHFLIKPKNEETIFGVFIVHGERKKLVNDLRDMVFYVSKTSYFGYKTDDKNNANKIFFPKLHGDKIVFYSMNTQKYHSFEGDYSSNDSFDFRRLDLATWIIPTLCPQLSRGLTSRELTWCPKLDKTTT